jgi:predicted nucleic acid-binding protein
MYLVDTNVISAGAPGRAVLYASLSQWMDERSERLYLSAITIAEIEEGIAKALRLGSARKANALCQWLQTILHLYGNRILPFETVAARSAGGLSDRARSMGQAPGFPDIAIAATAKIHDLTILTRNVRHFVSLGVSVHDPFVSLPK